VDYYGLFQKYKLDRPLGDEERKLQLYPKNRLDVAPTYACSMIRVNETYVEVVDKFYAAKGFAAIVTLLGIPMLVALALLEGKLFIVDGLFGEAYDHKVVTYVGGSGFVLGIAVLAFALWVLLKEAFCYTHYPIRFNRKTRMVHVFRFNGTVMSVPWDTLFFTLGRCNRFFGIQTWDVRAHVLDSDGTTVRETFSLAMAEAQHIVPLYWEYVRRYMEEGPQAVLALTPVYLPISKRRESWRFGLMRLALDGPWAVVVMIMLPLYLPMSLGRWFAMRTSKIPVWPKEIEEPCRIEPNDPYARDGCSNPKELWRVLWANRKMVYPE
jgi:hypothetical protein